MATIFSYDLKGKKLSFANWISNLSPTDTPFVSMTGKESISQTKFQWQTDYIDEPSMANAQIEGSVAVAGVPRATTVNTNVTQILRQVVSVTDTANVIASYGRGKELQYQMEKAGKEIKRDLEHAFLTQGVKAEGNGGTARTTAGFVGLVAGKNDKDPDTKAVVHTETAAAKIVTEADIFGLTYNLYMAGSDANTIMFHPKHASVFAGLMEAGVAGGRYKMFENGDSTFVHMVDSIVDPLGSEFRLIPNRFMPETAIYFFNPTDWTQMVFRAPERTKLAKDGSYDKWMIEMEVGLRHRNPYASGILAIKQA